MIRYPVAALVVVGIVPLLGPVQDPNPPTPARWQDDPVCRMVFFAVLEGLYEDGVPTEVADLIVPRGDNAVQHSFVAECPLCHPVLEAFRLYRSRKPFALDPKNGDTFGNKPVPPKTLEALKSDQVFTRISAMGALVQPWIERRLAMMRLSDDEMKEWRTRLLARAKQGGELYDKLKRTEGTVYREKWGFYGGCQACEAVERAVKK